MKDTWFCCNYSVFYQLQIRDTHFWIKDTFDAPRPSLIRHWLFAVVVIHSGGMECVATRLISAPGAVGLATSMTSKEASATLPPESLEAWSVYITQPPGECCVVIDIIMMMSTIYFSNRDRRYRVSTCTVRACWVSVTLNRWNWNCLRLDNYYYSLAT